jgi:hypothetical protein
MSERLLYDYFELEEVKLKLHCSLFGKCYENRPRN